MSDQVAFSFAGSPPPHPHAEHLERVSDRIANHVIAFVKGRGLARTFHMSELVTYVDARCPSAPGSAGRILRDLRKREIITVDLVSRRESLYRVSGWV